MAKKVLDLSQQALRNAQMAKFQDPMFHTDEWSKSGPGQVVDNNPVGYTDRSYETLKQVKMPLILDVVGRTPWTVEEIILAMGPSIRSLCAKYAGRRAAYQADEAESLALEAILLALNSDKGLAWFAGHCYERMESAITRGGRTSGIIKTSEKEKQWRDRVRSTEDNVGVGDATLGEFISGETSLMERRRCGDKRIVIDPKTNKPTEKFVATCTRDPKDRKYKVDGEICDRCGGRGLITVVVDRQRMDNPLDHVIRSHKKASAKQAWDIIAKELTPKQLEVLQLHLGLDRSGVPRPASEVAEILQQRELFALISETVAKASPTAEQQARINVVIADAKVKLETVSADADTTYHAAMLPILLPAAQAIDEILTIEQRVHTQKLPKMLGYPPIGGKNRVQQIMEVVAKKCKQMQGSDPRLTDLIDQAIDWQPGQIDPYA